MVSVKGERSGGVKGAVTDSGIWLEENADLSSWTGHTH